MVGVTAWGLMEYSSSSTFLTTSIVIVAAGSVVAGNVLI